MGRWISLAVVGLVVAVAVAYAASRLASPKVGLTSEPVSAGAKLTPQAVHKRKPSAPQPTRTVTAPAPAPSPSPSQGEDGGHDD